jgi:membrane protease YdiL (CAAX protease family)
MTYGILDHVLVALLALVAPLLGARDYRWVTARLAAGDAGVRVRVYRRTVVNLLAAAVVVLALWSLSGRPLERLVSLEWLPTGRWTVVAWGAVLLACVLLVMQVTSVRGNEAGLSSARKQMAPVEGYLPHTPLELKLFLAVSLAAGVCEEIVYRGYLLAYFDGLVGPWAAVLASTFMFGLGHAYQGTVGIVQTGAVGLLLAAAYVATGTLIAPVLLHIMIDASSGVLAYLALGPVTAAGGASDPATSTHHDLPDAPP